MNAKEAYGIAESAYEVKCAKQLDFILRQIEECASKGEFAYIAHQLYPENRKPLERLGYTVSIRHSIVNNITAYIIEWRNV
jgi:hypothetical protein